MAKNVNTVVQIEDGGKFIGHMTDQASHLFDQILAQTNIGRSKLISMLGLTHHHVMDEKRIMNLVQDINNRSRRGF
jgi:hypothetical protein